MSKYKVSVESSKSVEEAFAYMSDLRNFASWDPGVLTVTQVAGDGGGPESIFDVAVKSVGGGTVLRYERPTDPIGDRCGSASFPFQPSKQFGRNKKVRETFIQYIPGDKVYELIIHPEDREWL